MTTTGLAEAARTKSKITESTGLFDDVRRGLGMTVNASNGRHHVVLARGMRVTAVARSKGCVAYSIIRKAAT